MNPCVYPLSLMIDTLLRKRIWSVIFSFFIILPLAIGQNLTCPPEVTISCTDGQDPFPGDPDYNPNLGIPTLNIPCELVTFTYQDLIISGACTGTYTIERQWRGSGDCPDILACTQLIQVVDNMPPYATVITETTPELECGALDNPMIVLDWANLAVTTANAADDCSSVSVSHDFTLSSLPVINVDCGTGNSVGRYIVRFIYTDDCGNATSSFTNVFIFDHTPPAFAPISNLNLDCNDPSLDQKINTWLGAVRANDACRGQTLVNNDYTPGDFEPVQGCSFAQVVNFTTADECGNSSTTTGVITLSDNTPPVLTHPQPHLVLSCNDPNKDQLIDDWLGAVVVTEDCQRYDDPEYVYNPEGFSNPCGRVGDQEITFVSFNECGLEGRTTATITLLPELPQIICHSDQFITCVSDIIIPDQPVDWIGGCGSEGEPTYTGPILVSGTANCEGAVYEVMRSVIDDCGLEGICRERYIVRAPGPIVTCPSDEVVQCRADIAISINDIQYSTSCNLGASVRIVGPSINGRADCPGTVYSYRYLVTDDCGRMGFCDRRFTIANAAPSMNLAPDETVECLEDIQVSAADVIAMVSCGNDYTISISDPIQLGPDYCPGTSYTYTYTLQDACGRSISADRTFTLDNQGPQIIEAEDITVYCIDDIQVSTADIEVIAACGQAYEVTLEEPELHPDFNCTTVTLEYVYTVIDACGRTARDIRYITVEHRDPFIETPEPLYVDCLDENALRDNFPFSFSYCGDLKYSLEISDPKPYQPRGETCTYAFYKVLYSVTDDCGIMICVEQEVYAEEGWLEFSELPKDTLIDCGTVLPVPVVEARGSCDEGLTVDFSEEERSDEDSGAIYWIRRWTAESACGQVWEHQQKIRQDCSDVPNFTANDRNQTVSKTSTNTGLQLFPNPAVDRLRVRYPYAGLEESKAILSIFNIHGQRVKVETADVFQGDNQFDLNVAGLSDGTFTLVLQVDNEDKQSYRFVKVSN